MLTLTAHTEQLLQILALVATILMVPVAVVLLVVLFQAIFLLHSVNELLGVVSAELVPVLKNLRQAVEHMQMLGQQASSSVQDLGQAFQQAGPLMKKGVDKAKGGAMALLSGLGRAFQKKVS